VRFAHLQVSGRDLWNTALQHIIHEQQLAREHAMTHSFKKHAILLTGLMGLGMSAYANQPPDVVQSDAFGNTAMGSDALLSLPSQATAGDLNTAAGVAALKSNTTGASNTAFGGNTLSFNTSGIANTATGVNALTNNTTGENNTALGYQSMIFNISGNDNTATGLAALNDNVSGSSNTASGEYALGSNTIGSNNTAIGFDTLFSLTNGNNNTAVGSAAAAATVFTQATIGSNNALFGAMAIAGTGSNNVLLGYSAGFNATILAGVNGSNNIAVGTNAGSNWNNGSDNIDIGNLGTSGENGIIRIGTPKFQTAAYIAGINSSYLRGRQVIISDDGRLGVEGSSERFKTDISPMSSNTAKIDELRPVTFRLKSDPHGPILYGLIAEEVAKVYPELVTHDAEGKIDGVRYEELGPMLLNEVQKQAAEIRDLKKLVVEMQGGLMKLQAKDELVARR
jgi:hypothetical protein